MPDRAISIKVVRSAWLVALKSLGCGFILAPSFITVLCLSLICIGFGPPSCLLVFGKVYRLFVLRQLSVLLVFVRWAIHRFGMVYLQEGVSMWQHCYCWFKNVLFILYHLMCRELKLYRCYANENWVWICHKFSLITVLQEVQKATSLR